MSKMKQKNKAKEKTVRSINNNIRSSVRKLNPILKGIVGKINLKNSIYKDKIDPIEKDCPCYTCKNFTLSYLYHLFASRELLALQLLTHHNVFFMNKLMKTIRVSIQENNYESAKKEWLEN